MVQLYTGRNTASINGELSWDNGSSYANGIFLNPGDERPKVRESPFDFEEGGELDPQSRENIGEVVGGCVLGSAPATLLLGGAASALFWRIENWSERGGDRATRDDRSDTGRCGLLLFPFRSHWVVRVAAVLEAKWLQCI